MNSNFQGKRIWQIDFLRGIGIVLVVLYHFLFDLNYLHIIAIDFQLLPLVLFQRIAASTLIIVSGISLSLMHQKFKSQGKPFLPQLLKRFFIIAAAALLVTIATFVYPHDGLIAFGILHFLALSSLIAFFFLEFNALNGLLGLLLIILGFFTSNFGNFFPLFGFQGFTLDYFPLIPWFGVVLLGIHAAKQHLNSIKTALKAVGEGSITSKFFQWAGRNSLLIYLVHQPIFFAFFYFLGFFRI